jgi:hypothetical protein
MTSLPKFILLFLCFLIVTGIKSQISLEGISHPSLAQYLTSDSARFFPEITQRPEINFKTMYVYHSISDYDIQHNIDTSKLHLDRTLAFSRDSNLLTDIFYYPSANPSFTIRKSYFNEAGKIARRTEEKAESHYTQLISESSFSYTKNGNINDTSIYQYDTLGRLIRYKSYRLASSWTKLFYKDVKSTNPYLSTTLEDSVLLFYEGKNLVKSVNKKKYLAYGYYSDASYQRMWVLVNQFSYNKKGQLDEEIIYDNYYESNSCRKKFTYNETGLLTSIGYYYLYTDILFRKLSFTYDKNNLLVKKEQSSFPQESGIHTINYFSYDDKHNIVRIELQATSWNKWKETDWRSTDSKKIYRFSYSY